MKLLRFMHMIYAKVSGRFWLPCPICGAYFGGHEVTPETPSVPVGDHAFLVCPRQKCHNEAISRNLAEWYKVPFYRNLK